MVNSFFFPNINESGEMISPIKVLKQFELTRLIIKAPDRALFFHPKNMDIFLICP